MGPVAGAGFADGAAAGAGAEAGAAAGAVMGFPPFGVVGYGSDHPTHSFLWRRITLLPPRTLSFLVSQRYRAAGAAGAAARQE